MYFLSAVDVPLGRLSIRWAVRVTFHSFIQFIMEMRKIPPPEPEELTAEELEEAQLLLDSMQSRGTPIPSPQHQNTEEVSRYTRQPHRYPIHNQRLEQKPPDPEPSMWEYVMIGLIATGVTFGVWQLGQYILDCVKPSVPDTPSPSDTLDEETILKVLQQLEKAKE